MLDRLVDRLRKTGGQPLGRDYEFGINHSH
jgi:hypothetical protein